MAEILDVFKQDAFGTITLTDAINKMPFVPGRLGQLGLFQAGGVATLTIAIEEVDGKLSLLSTSPRSGPATKYTPPKRTIRNLNIPHIPFDSHVAADEVQGVRMFGTDNQMQAVQEVVNQRLAEMIPLHDATLEWHRIGAVKGIVYDADGTTAIYNLFTEFGVTQETEVDFDLDNASPASGAVRKKCNSVLRLIRKNLGATPYTGIMGICGSAFWDDLTAHAEVRTSYERWAEGQQQGAWLRQGLVSQFSGVPLQYGGIMFEEYVGGVGLTDFVNTDKCHFFPVGVPGLFRTYYGPANWMEAVNTMGLPRYAKIVNEDPANRYVSVMTQQNPLNICTRPKVLIQAKRT